MRTFALQWSLDGVYATARVQRYYVFTITNKHGRSTEANVMSSTAFCGRILSAPRKKDGESGTKTQNRQGFVCCWSCWSRYDAKTAKNSFRGIQSRIPGADLGGGCRECAPPPPEMTCGFLIQLVFCEKKNYVVYWCWIRARDECIPPIKKILDPPLNTMSGVITIIKGITFPLFAWKKCFFPRKVRWRIEATFFTSSCIVAWFLLFLVNYVCKSRFSGLFFGLWNHGIN